MSTFPTAAKVYPSHLPQMTLKQTRRLPSKWYVLFPVGIDLYCLAILTRDRLTTVAAVGAAGYAANSYASHARDRRLAEARMAEAAQAERRRALEDLNDEYGARATLEELERAVQHYEKK